MRCGACGAWSGWKKRPCPQAETRHPSRRSLGKKGMALLIRRAMRSFVLPISRRVGYAEMLQSALVVERQEDFERRGELSPWERRDIEGVAAQRKVPA